MFFGFLGIAQMLGPPHPRNTVQRSEMKPLPVGPFVAIPGFILFMSCVIVGMISGLNVGLMAFTILYIGIGSLASMGISGTRRAHRDNQDLRRLPDRPQGPLFSPTDMRLRATQLSSRQGQSAPKGGTAVLLKAPPSAAPRTVTVRQLQQDKDEDTRLMRVAAILVVGCPLCQAQDTELCEPIADQVWCQLDGQRGIFAHPQRIGFAIKARIANVEDIVAQFEGSVPDEVWEAAL